MADVNSNCRGWECQQHARQTCQCNLEITTKGSKLHAKYADSNRNLHPFMNRLIKNGAFPICTLFLPLSPYLHVCVCVSMTKQKEEQSRSNPSTPALTPAIPVHRYLAGANVWIVASTMRILVTHVTSLATRDASDDDVIFASIKLIKILPKSAAHRCRPADLFSQSQSVNWLYQSISLQ